VAVAVLLLWLAGLGLLARREFFPDEAAELAEAALLIAPGTEYYAVMAGDRHIGFASSSIDTVGTGIRIVDYLVADLRADGATHRAAVRITSDLSRGLRLRGFRFQLGGDAGPMDVRGSMTSDSLLTLVSIVGDARPDTQQIRVTSPLLLPTVVPIAVALRSTPDVGDESQYTMFDPASLTPTPVTVRVVAESLFVVSDSAHFDDASQRWVSAHDDTVRAWRIEQSGTGFIGGWVDAKGRMVTTSQLGTLRLRRTAYEMAYLNWPLETAARGESSGGDPDIQETTAIAASAPIANKQSVSQLRVRLRHVDLAGFQLEGDRQRLAGDTLTVRRETDDQLTAAYRLPNTEPRFRAELGAEPLVQSNAREIVRLARQIAAGESDPTLVARRINEWVSESLRKTVSFTVPNALQVLQARRGDCNEHTQLYIALARAAGIPARAAAGLAYVGGKFYYHAWPEVYLGDWVAVDPTFGQFPADAAHLRFVIGGYARQAELLRLIGTLDIDVLSIE
jgi:hypothetical protein